MVTFDKAFCEALQAELETIEQILGEWNQLERC